MILKSVTTTFHLLQWPFAKIVARHSLGHALQLWLPGGGLVHVHAIVDPTAVIEAAAVVQEGSRIGRNCQVGSASVIGPDVSIGDGTILGHQVSLADSLQSKLNW